MAEKMLAPILVALRLVHFSHCVFTNYKPFNHQNHQKVVGVHTYVG